MTGPGPSPRPNVKEELETFSLFKSGKECPLRGAYTSNPVCVEKKCAMWVDTARKCSFRAVPLNLAAIAVVLVFVAGIATVVGGSFVAFAFQALIGS
jgi:hypothetical protein